ncbi:MAG: thioredoxin [Gammaproteobacteria bacterium]|nr:thioredoxin [Gammaproteobacteria bacterium]
MSEVIKLQDATFEQEVLQSTTPVLVDYWAEWCGPCRAVAPVVEAAAAQYNGRLKVAKLNVDESDGIPARYGIRSIPTLMLFVNGQVAATQVGSVTQAQLDAFLQANI